MSEEKTPEKKQPHPLLNLQTLQNIRGMLNRVGVTGPEAFEWVRLRQILDAAITELS